MNKNKKILLIDDSSIDRNILSEVLKKKGFEVFSLADETAFLSTIETTQPDAILLDIMMPKISGIEILREIRKKYNTVELPIIMTTGKIESSDVIDCLSLGANDYLTKPVEFDVALTRIHTQLKIAELSKELVRLKELELSRGLIAMYNHEINNALSLAIGALENMSPADDKNHQRMSAALWKIDSLMKQTQRIHEGGSVEFVDYVGKTKLVKVK